MHNYSNLQIWQQAMELVVEVYKLTKTFPAEEKYGLVSQMNRAAVSVPSNIAEGMGRMAIKERIHFLEISYASMTEVLCQLDISESLGYITIEELKKGEEISDRLARVMSGLRKSLNEKNNNNE